MESRDASDNHMLRTAGVAVASSAAVLAARHLLGRRSEGKARGGETLSASADAAWQSARDVLLPALEDAAVSAGRYVGENVPETVRKHILPRFVAGMHEALEQFEADDAEAAFDET